MYATRPAKSRKIAMDVQGDFFSTRPLLLGATLSLRDEGLAEPRTLLFIVAVLIISPQ
jgi:hypothetical protein